MILNKVKNIFSTPLVRYMINSVLVSIVDVIIVYVLYRGFRVYLIAANTTGVLTGFILHYLLSSKTVFQAKFGMKGFIIYFSTFLFGLILADWLIYFGDQKLLLGWNRDLRFLFNKGISVVVPFFVLYFIRRLLFNQLNSRSGDIKNTMAN